ncbi:MAG: menaquinone biosynthesis decarboxylase [Bacteroidota bacterium]
MSYQNLQHFIDCLEAENELIRLKTYFSPELEITEVTERIIKSGINKAILFENTGYDFPVLMNAFGSEKRMSMALGVENLNDIVVEIDHITHGLMGAKTSWMDKLKTLPLLKKISGYFPYTSNKRGECQEIVMQTPDITKLPVLKCWPFDGGNFITFPVVHTKDPVNGTRNVGMYRMQVFDGQTTGMHWHLHKNSARHYNAYKEMNKRMPVVVTLGGDPAYTYSATAPLPDNLDEYIFAGFLRKKAVKMVKCLTVDLEVPADVDFVIEGYVDPTEALRAEGPFGDHTGFYSLTDNYPVFHITCITHRKNAVYPATIVGIPPQEDGWMGKATERIFLKPIQMTIAPEIIDMHMPFEGVFHNIVIVKINQTYPGQAIKVMNALWGAGQMMFNKYLIVVDAVIDIASPVELMKVMAQNLDPLSCIYFNKGPLDVLDHASPEFVYGGKMGIDATQKKGDVNVLLENLEMNDEKMMLDFPKIKSVNLGASQWGILCCQIEKAEGDSIKAFHSVLVQFLSKYCKGISTVVYFDVDVSNLDMPTLVWFAANQTDAVRDCWVETVKIDSKERGVLGIDASRKKLSDGFKRQWPQVVMSDEQTIKSIDEKWKSSIPFEFVASPSLKYKALSPGNAAVWPEGS